MHAFVIDFKWKMSSFSKLLQLLTCRVASLFLVGHTREYVCIPYVVVRDILHEYLPLVSGKALVQSIRVDSIFSI